MSKRMKLFLLFAAVVAWFGRDGARGQETSMENNLAWHKPTLWQMVEPGKTSAWIQIAPDNNVTLKLDGIGDQTLTIKSGSVTVTIPLKELLDRLSVTKKAVVGPAWKRKYEDVSYSYEIRPYEATTATKPRLYHYVDPITGKEHFGATKVKKLAPAVTESPLQGGQWRQQP